MAASGGTEVDASKPGETRLRAAQYVRMSTDHQRYSTENQADAILKYAETHGMEIVRTYSDEGKSGLNIGGREGLQRLLEDIQGRSAHFEVLLVYDISRWGRFQDADESAYYEYLCRRAGVRVVYCAEPFENDGTPMATIFKSVKRAMAGEYSRELSSKVFAGQCRLIELGFRQGGVAGYGLRRLLVDDKGQAKGILGPGEHKSLQTDRVILVPGPADEVAIVKQVYQRFVVTGMTERAIADQLNVEGVAADQGRPWTRGAVHHLLTNEKYVGHNVFNRSSFKLKQKRVRNPPEMWVRAEGAFEPVVPEHLFQQARQIILERSRRFTDEEMLAKLRRLFETKGPLSGLIIDQEEAMPSSSAYRSRFGSLLRAYQLIGYRPQRDYRYLRVNARLRDLYPTVVAQVVAGVREAGGTVAGPGPDGLLRVNDELTLSIVIARCRQTQAGSYRWRLHFDTSLAPDITIAVRMDAANRAILDFYFFPRIDLISDRLRLAEENGLSLDAYRFADLSDLFALTARIPFAEAA
jgi:DNA invertase Pin-like site-specific DNA recombinase